MKKPVNKTKKEKYIEPKPKIPETIPAIYIKKFNKFMEFEDKKVNRIIQEDLEYFKRKIPKRYKDRFTINIQRGFWPIWMKNV